MFIRWDSQEEKFYIDHVCFCFYSEDKCGLGGRYGIVAWVTHIRWNEQVHLTNGSIKLFCYRATIQAIAVYLDAFQKIADAATNTRGKLIFYVSNYLHRKKKQRQLVSTNSLIIFLKKCKVIRRCIDSTMIVFFLFPHFLINS